eukprot:Em0001g2926a
MAYCSCYVALDKMGSTGWNLKVELQSFNSIATYTPGVTLLLWMAGFSQRAPPCSCCVALDKTGSTGWNLKVELQSFTSITTGSTPSLHQPGHMSRQLLCSGKQRHQLTQRIPCDHIRMAKIRYYLADLVCSGLPLADLLKPHPLTDIEGLLQGEKKRVYEQAVVERRGNFTPIVLSVDDLLHMEAKHFVKRIVANLAHKWEKPYSQTCGFVRARLAFAIIRATSLCLHVNGSRVK